jgi:hypothetical protein
MGEVKANDKKKAALKVLDIAPKSTKSFSQEELALASKPLIIESPIRQDSSLAVQEDHLRESISKSIESLNNATERLQKSSKKMMLETELRNPVLRTDFDRVLKMVLSEGVVSAGKIRTELNIDNIRLKECFETLQRAGKVRVEYPLFGPPKLISVEFEKEKKRKDQIRRGITPEDDIEEGH